jgi:hypothetical protein
LREYYSAGLLLLIIHAQHFPLERLYKRGRSKVEDCRKEEVRKRDYFFHPQLNTNPMMERDLGAGNRNKVLIEGVFLGEMICPELYLT